MDTIKFDSKQVKVIAHRGLSGLERENTYPAFVAASHRSYFGIETDIRVTADGEFILMHDETTERVSLGENNVNVISSNFSEIKDLVFPDIDGSTNRRDIKIARLIDYVNICKKCDKICVIEIKSPFDEDKIKRMIKVIEDADYLKNVIFISFSFEYCVLVRKNFPDAEIQWLSNWEVTEEDINNLVEHKLDLDIHFKRINAETIERLHSLGIKVNCWTCDDKSEAEELAKMGIDFITTNILE